MKKNHLLLLLAVAIVVGLAGIYFQISQSAQMERFQNRSNDFSKLADQRYHKNPDSINVRHRDAREEG